MTTDLPRWVHFNVLKEYYQDRPYRLWRGPPVSAGEPIIILIHGEVVPLVGAFHDPTTINNNRYCLYDLDSLLYQDFHYNVFTFEYADKCVRDRNSNKCFRDPFTEEEWYFNYGDITKYGDRLKEAIGFAKEKSKTQDDKVGPVTVIAHSIGGLVARYVAKQAAGTINKIITLDTGHRGFRLARYIDEILEATQIILPTGTECTKDVEEGSAFINELNGAFDPDNPKLVSLAATEPIPTGFFAPGIPRGEVTVVDSNSSNMGQVYSLPCNHVSIAQIADSNHKAYKIIKEVVG